MSLESRNVQKLVEDREGQEEGKNAIIINYKIRNENAGARYYAQR